MQVEQWVGTLRELCGNSRRGPLDRLVFNGRFPLKYNLIWYVIFLLLAGGEEGLDFDCSGRLSVLGVSFALLIDVGLSSLCIRLDRR